MRENFFGKKSVNVQHIPIWWMCHSISIVASLSLYFSLKMFPCAVLSLGICSSLLLTFDSDMDSLVD